MFRPFAKFQSTEQVDVDLRPLIVDNQLHKECYQYRFEFEKLHS